MILERVPKEAVTKIFDITPGEEQGREVGQAPTGRRRGAAHKPDPLASNLSQLCTSFLVVAVSRATPASCTFRAYRLSPDQYAHLEQWCRFGFLSILHHSGFVGGGIVSLVKAAEDPKMSVGIGVKKHIGILNL